MEKDLVVDRVIQQAWWLYNGFSNDLSSSRWFKSSLDQYKKEIERTWALMERYGLPRLCAFCATKIPGGGCCGQEIATWYDPYTILLNLFMDVEIPSSSYYENSCRFLGKDGCVLRARYHFCVNYLCKRIKDHLSPGELEELQAQSGLELFKAWELEVFLQDFFHKKGVSMAGGSVEGFER